MTGISRTQFRAVFLAALMFLWVFAGTMAFAGGAAAQASGGSITDTQPVEPESTVTVEVDSSSVAQGNDLYVAYDEDGDGKIQEDEVAKVVASSNSGTQSIEFTPTDAEAVDISTTATETVAVFEDPGGDQADGDTESNDFTVSDTTEASDTLNVDPAADDELVVNDDGSAEYTTISAAVGASDSQDTIIVEDGTYNEDVAVDNINDLTITAADGASPTIVGKNAKARGTVNLIGGASKITISGLTIQPDAGADATVFVNTEGTTESTFEQNTIVGADGDVSAFIQGGHEDIAFTENTFTAADGAEPSKHLYLGGEASFSSFKSATSSDNADTVTGNNFEGAVSDVALEVESQYSTVTGNDFGAVSPTSDVAIPGAILDGNNPGIESVNGETDRNGQINAVIEDNTGVEATNPFAINPSISEITVGNSEQVSAEIAGLGDESVDYALVAPTDDGSFALDDTGGQNTELPADSSDTPFPHSDDVVTSGTSSDGSFSALLDASEVGDYTIVVEGASTANDGAATVTSTYTVENRSLDPASPVYEDDLTVTGELADGSGNAPDSSKNVVLVDPSGGEVSSTSSSTSSGEFLVSGTVNDAGTYELADSAKDSRTVYDEIDVGSQTANVTVEADGNNEGGFEQTYTISVEDENGDPIDVGSLDGYVNVTGEFDGTVTDDSASGGSFAQSTPDSNTVAVHATPDNNDEIVITGTPLTSTESIDATLEFNDGGGAGDFDAATYYGGLEATSPADTPDTPDVVGSDSLAVTGAGDLNVALLSGDTLSAASGEQTVKVEVLGSDGEGPDGTKSNTGGGDGKNALDTATISLSGPNVDDEITLGDDEESKSATFTTVDPNEAGTITAEISATTDAGETFSDNLTVDVTGDIIESVSPTDVAIDDNNNVSVEVTDADGQAVNNRVINIDATSGDEGELTVFDQDGGDSGTVETGVSTLVIDGGAGTVTAEGGDAGSPADTIETGVTVNNGVYTASNVTFSATGSFDVSVGSTTAEEAEAITVSGIDAYEINTDVDPALAGTTDQHNITISEDGSQVTGDALGDFTLSVSQEDGDALDITQSNPTLVDTDNDGNDDTIQADVTPASTAALNITVDDGNARTGDASIDVVEPDVNTALNGGDLTTGLTTDLNVTVEDPRDGSALSDATVQFSATNATFIGTADDGFSFSGDGTLADGETETVTLDSEGRANVSIAPQAGSNFGDQPVSLTLAAQDDGTNYYGDNVLNVSNITIDAPAELEPSSEESLVLEVTDANGEGIDLLGIGISGTGIDGSDQTEITDEGLINVELTTADSGTIQFDAVDDGITGSTDLVTDATDGNSDDRTLIAETNVFEEIALNLSADTTSIDTGGSANFTLVREDFNQQTNGNLTVTNASDAVVQEVSIDGTASITFDEAGDYTVTAEKATRSEVGKAFTDDSVNVTVNAPASPSASATFNDQTVANGTEEVTVANANYTLADGTAGDYVVVAHVVNDDGSISNAVGYSSNVTGDTDGITVDLNASEAQGDALDTLSANTTLRAMLHETSSDSAFGASLGLATDDANITVTADDGGPETPEERALVIAGVDDPAQLTQDDVTAAITRFNRGESVNGLTIEQDDVTAVITLFERN